MSQRKWPDGLRLEWTAICAHGQTSLGFH